MQERKKFILKGTVSLSFPIVLEGMFLKNNNNKATHFTSFSNISTGIQQRLADILQLR